MRNKNRIILLTGKEGFGKTVYARKLIYYVIEREMVSELVYVNCKDYHSVADFCLNFSVFR